MNAVPLGDADVEAWAEECTQRRLSRAHEAPAKVKEGKNEEGKEDEGKGEEGKIRSHSAPGRGRRRRGNITAKVSYVGEMLE